MKFLIIGTALTLGLTSFAQTMRADTLVGTWTCASTGAQAQGISNVEFTDEGKMRAILEVDFNGAGQDVTAQVKYWASYVFTDNMLSDTPERAKITAFRVNGQDARKSDDAIRLQESLMSDSDAAAKVQFTSEKYMRITANKAVINCVRMDG